MHSSVSINTQWQMEVSVPSLLSSHCHQVYKPCSYDIYTIPFLSFWVNHSSVYSENIYAPCSFAYEQILRKTFCNVLSEKEFSNI